MAKVSRVATPCPGYHTELREQVAGSIRGRGVWGYGSGHSRQRTPTPPNQPPVEPLTERELEVIELMAAGKSNQDIAEEQVIAVNTVRSQVKSIYGKLGASNRVQAVVRAQELNLIAS